MLLLKVHCCCCCVTTGEKASYSHHASLMQQLFDQLGVDTTKLTHEHRIFAAQLLYEMGVSLEVSSASLLQWPMMPCPT